MIRVTSVGLQPQMLHYMADMTVGRALQDAGVTTKDRHAATVNGKRAGMDDPVAPGSTIGYQPIGDNG